MKWDAGAVGWAGELTGCGVVQKNYGVGRSGVMYDGARELEMEPSLDWGTVGWCWITVDGPVWLWDCLGSCFMGMENGGRDPRALPFHDKKK